MLPVILVTGVCLLTSSCGSLLNSGKPADRIFLLEPLAGSQDLQTGSSSKLVVEVKAVPGLDTDQLLTLSPDAELNHFSGVRWPDHLPEFAGSLVRRSLQQTGWFSSVTEGYESGHADCVLDLEIQRFYTLVDSSGAALSVQIGMSGAVACEDGNKPLELDAHARVAGQQLSHVVAAHQQAMDDLLRSLVSQLEELPHRSGSS